jgi:hypothetical protein
MLMTYNSYGTPIPLHVERKKLEASISVDNLQSHPSPLNMLFILSELGPVVSRYPINMLERKEGKKKHMPCSPRQ